MANTGQGGFWGASFNPQQFGQQWGQGLRSAFTNNTSDPQAYAKGLASALLGGQQGLSMMPEQVQQRAQDWFGIGAPISAPPSAPATPITPTPATPASSPTPQPAAPASSQPEGRPYWPGASWNEQMGSWMNPGRGQQIGTKFSQFGTRVR